MTHLALKTKNMGQVFTPENIVNDILDAAGYNGQKILKKHIMENSCGNGAFLCEIVRRYSSEYLKKYPDDLIGLSKDLKRYIHGIEKDEDALSSCYENLEAVCEEFGLSDAKFDLIQGDTLSISKFDGKMNYVVGNPPYVRVHNLEDNYENVKKFKFSQNGMTDIFIVFFEIGLKMLKKNGVLSYITPNSYYTSVAGKELRKYIQTTRSLYKIMELGHYNPFPVITYTAISCFKKGHSFDSVEYDSYSTDGTYQKQADIPYDRLFLDGKIYLYNPEKNDDLGFIFEIDKKKYPQIQVKNGFATLADSVFIKDSFDFDSDHIIPVLKGSTGEWKQCIYPYDREGNLLSLDKMDQPVQEYLNRNREKLERRSVERDSPWYAFGRSQAISDVYRDKIAINILVKTPDTLKIEKVPAGSGVYSGLYILSDFDFDTIKNVLMDESFIDYVKMLDKCKNGGYYTFSSADVNKYLIFKLGLTKNETRYRQTFLS